MKAAYALLVPRAIENRVQHLAWDIHRRWRTGVRPRGIPPHVSLKQPFDVGDDLAAAENCLADFAREVGPVSIRCRGYLRWDTVLAVDVEPTATLRGLHARVNRDLAAVLADPRAPFDGDLYHFHLTVMTGGATVDAYREIHESLAGQPFADTFLAREVAMFVYDDTNPGELLYMLHTVHALEGLASASE